MKALLYPLFFGILYLTLYACANPPDYPIEPVIEYKRITKNRLDQSAFNADSTLITIGFTDGDGDIGNEDSVSIFIIDNRTDFEQPGFKIPYIGEQGVGKGISGEISFVLFTSCCIYENGLTPCEPSTDFPLDTLSYDIYIIDRAGNASNRITTEPLFIRCN